MRLSGFKHPWRGGSCVVGGTCSSPGKKKPKATPKTWGTPSIPLPSHPPGSLRPPRRGCPPAGVPGRPLAQPLPRSDHPRAQPRAADPPPPGGSRESSGTGIIPRLHPAAFPQVPSGLGDRSGGLPWHRERGIPPGTSRSSRLGMEAAGTVAAPAAEGSVKWQLCYDVRAKTWWMVSGGRRGLRVGGISAA